MSSSDGSESLDSMDDDVTQVPRGRRSKVWEHYEQDLVAVDGDLKAVCKYCRAELQAKFGTSSLRSHIAESCRSIDDACRNRFLSTMKNKPSEGVFVFDPKVCRELMEPPWDYSIRIPGHRKTEFVVALEPGMQLDRSFGIQDEKNKDANNKELHGQTIGVWDAKHKEDRQELKSMGQHGYLAAALPNLKPFESCFSYFD